MFIYPMQIRRILLVQNELKEKEVKFSSKKIGNKPHQYGVSFIISYITIFQQPFLNMALSTINFPYFLSKLTRAIIIQ